MKTASIKALWAVSGSVIIGVTGGVGSTLTSPTIKVPFCKGGAAALSLCDTSVRSVTGVHLLSMWASIAVALCLLIVGISYWVSGWEV